MKQLLLIVSVVSLLLAACEKNALVLPADELKSGAGARLRILNVAPDLPGGLQVDVNGKKFSAFTPIGATVSSPGIPGGITFGNAFPALTWGYALVTPGTLSMSLTSPATTTATSATTIGSASTTVEDDKYYTMVVSGTGTQPETFFLKDDFSQLTASNRYYVRFINLIPNAPVTGYDMGVQGFNGQVTLLARNVGYKTATEFFPIDVSTGNVLVFRTPGGTTNVATSTFTLIPNGRVITLFVRGVVGRTGTAAPAMGLYINR